MLPLWPIKHYAPLDLTFENDPDRPGVIASTSHMNCGTRIRVAVLLQVTASGAVFAGSEESPGEVIRFVNSSVDAFAKFLQAHADYTNRFLFCQTMEGESFEELFLREIRSLLDQFHEIDTAALDRRDCWWPQMMDPILAKYRRVVER